ncbi:MAG TPA: alpha/beta hydrolase [Candidatus Limnocylindrales bacterium]|nr:alpha/beta hydrolase [Candidatus Limnocylindrales bacterium]
MTAASPAPGGFVKSPDGTQIAWWDEIGPTADLGRPALVLVHGATADHTAFRTVAPRFAARRRVVSIDRRGRGLSSDHAPYAIEREYEDVAAVVDWLAASTGQRVDVVGHSFGGRCGLGAARLTSNLRRLVVYEGAPAPAGRSFHDAELLARLDALAAAGDVDGVMATFMAEVVGQTPDEVNAYRRSPTWPTRAAAAPTAIRELRAEAGRDADAEGFAEIRIPVLQLIGAASPELFTDGTRELDDRLQDGRVVSLPGQKHAAHHTSPDLFVAAVEGFLDERDTIAP